MRCERRRRAPTILGTILGTVHPAWGAPFAPRVLQRSAFEALSTPLFIYFPHFSLLFFFPRLHFLSPSFFLRLLFSSFLPFSSPLPLFSFSFFPLHTVRSIFPSPPSSTPPAQSCTNPTPSHPPAQHFTSSQREKKTSSQRAVPHPNFPPHHTHTHTPALHYTLITTSLHPNESNSAQTEGAPIARRGEGV